MSSRMIQTTDTPTITMGDGTNSTASGAQREEEPAVVSDDDDEDFRSVQRNHIRTSQRDNHNTTSTITGTRVRMIGGVHMGKMGILVKRTPKKMAVIVDGEIPTARYLDPSNVEILGKEHDTNRCDAPTHERSGIPPSASIRPTSTTTTAAAATTTPVALKVGGEVLVIGGSYRGQYGTIRKETPHRIAVEIVDDTTGNFKTHYLAKHNVQPIISSSTNTAPITHDHQPVPATPIPNETRSSPPLADQSIPTFTTLTRRDQAGGHAASFRGTRPPQVPADVITITDYLFATNHGANDDPRAVLSSTMSMSSLPLSSRSLSTCDVEILNQDDSSHRSDTRSPERSGMQSVQHTTTTTAIEASTTPVVLQVGGTVLVNHGSYCGQYGTIEKVTPHKVAVRIVRDGIGTTHYLSKSHVERHLIEL